MNQLDRDPYLRLVRTLRRSLGENAEEKFLAIVLVPLAIAVAVIHVVG